MPSRVCLSTINANPCPQMCRELRNPAGVRRSQTLGPLTFRRPLRTQRRALFRIRPSSWRRFFKTRSDALSVSFTPPCVVSRCLLGRGRREEAPRVGPVRGARYRGGGPLCLPTLLWVSRAQHPKSKTVQKVNGVGSGPSGRGIVICAHVFLEVGRCREPASLGGRGSLAASTNK